MQHNLLEQLRSYTVVVADTGDIEAMEKFRPQDATTNPSLITAAAQLPRYQPIVDSVLMAARKELGRSAPSAAVVHLAFQRLAIAFGKKILAIVPGRVSTEVDARLSFDTQATIAQARGIIAQYDAEGIGRERVLIKIASTWEGIRAAEVLEREGIHCNLTLLFGLHQAIACAEAGVTLISPFVGRILDWYKKDTGKDFHGAGDPGVKSVTTVYNYYKKYGYKTQIMGASFRNIGEIIELAGCDLLTISPQLLSELEATQADLPRKLSPDAARALSIEKIVVDKAAFDAMHAADRMATDKLKEGIDGFSTALVKLETLLAQRLFTLEASTLSYNPPPPMPVQPVITGITSVTGQLNSCIISGSGFALGLKVTIYENGALLVTIQGKQITNITPTTFTMQTVPLVAGTYTVQVTNADQSISAPFSFNVAPAE